METCKKLCPCNWATNWATGQLGSWVGLLEQLASPCAGAFLLLVLACGAATVPSQETGQSSQGTGKKNTQQRGRRSGARVASAKPGLTLYSNIPPRSGIFLSTVAQMSVLEAETLGESSQFHLFVSDINYSIPLAGTINA